jgi:hypothetical protein
LGIQFLPAALGVPRTFYDVVGLQYTFKAGDLKDASFALRLSSERLASLSPANAMSLGEGAQVVKIIGHSSVDQTLDWGQEFFGQVTVVSVISGKAMVGWTVTWRSPDLGVVTSVTDYYGVARVRFVPETPGEAELTATVGDRESVALSYFLNEPREIQTLSSPDPAGFPGDEVSADAIVVSAITGEPLWDVEVMWDFPGVTIAPTRTNKEGKTSVMFRLSANMPSVLGASVRGGKAGWDTALLMFTVEDRQLAFVQLIGNGQYYVGQTARLSCRLVDNTTGEGVVGVDVAFFNNGVFDVYVKSADQGVLSRHYQSDRYQHYEVLMRFLNSDGTVNVEQRAGIVFLER